MSDRPDSPFPVPGPLADVDALRAEMDAHRRVLRLVLLALIIGTTGLSLFMYRQTKLLRFQILAQQQAVQEADRRMAPMLNTLPIFQRVGGQFPDFATHVLRPLALPPLPPTNAASGAH